MITLYGDARSGNCHKARWALTLAGRPFEWREVEVTSGLTRSAEFLAINPAGQVPALVLEDGRLLAQSNAILLHFGEGTPLVPAEAYERAKVYEWLFWEQYSHEPYVAVRRYLLAFLGKAPEETDPKLFERGSAALARLDAALQGRDWLVGETMTVADMACVAYTRLAHEGGFDLDRYPAVKAWVARCEARLPL